MPDHSIHQKPPGTLRAALVFPAVGQKSAAGLPPGNRSRTPARLKPSAFRGESLDFVLFPEGYVHAQDDRQIHALSGLAMALRAPLLVGAVERRPDAWSRLADWQVLLHFKPDGTHNRVYTKHSTAEAVAFGEPDWNPKTMLPTFELGGETIGATICHDHYLGLLQRSLSQRGARVWVNPSYDNVTDLKWCCFPVWPVGTPQFPVALIRARIGRDGGAMRAAPDSTTAAAQLSRREGGVSRR